MADCNAVAVSSRLVVDQTFTLGGVDVRTHFIVDHCCVNVFIRVLNFRSWSQPRNYFNSKIFPTYGILVWILINAMWLL